VHDHAPKLFDESSIIAHVERSCIGFRNYLIHGISSPNETTSFKLFIIPKGLATSNIVFIIPMELNYLRYDGIHPQMNYLI
jgi:hypothetical protein